MKWGSTLKVGMAGLLAMATLVSLPGCTDEEVSASLAVIAIGAAVGAVVADPPHGECQGRYETQCNDYEDYWGNYHQDCRTVYNSCAYYGENLQTEYLALNDDGEVSISNILASQATEKLSSPRVNALATKYQLSTAASEKLLSGLDALSAGNKEALASLGLTTDSIKALARLKVPSEENLSPVAQSLGVSVATVHSMVQDVVGQIKVQAADVKSNYWTSCMATGTWKTNANLYCADTTWNGCSPDTGATLCLAK